MGRFSGLAVSARNLRLGRLLDRSRATFCKRDKAIRPAALTKLYSQAVLTV